MQAKVASWWTQCLQCRLLLLWCLVDPFRPGLASDD